MSVGLRRRKGAVNQRSSIASMMPSIPLASTVRMRSCQTDAASAGYRLVVSQSTRLRTIAGWRSAKVWPIIPPMEMPA